MTLNCIIIDDEKLARELLEEYCAKIPELKVCGSFSSPLAAHSVLHAQSIDLMFLDIQMPHLTGIDFLKTLRHPPIVIFTTAYSEHALEAFQLDVIDYLLKPIVFERFFQAIQKVLRLSAEKQNTDPVLSPHPPADPIQDFVFIRADQLIHKVFTKDILYIESLRNYNRIYTTTQRIVFRQAMNALLDLLPDDYFFRIHRSYIINVQHIDQVEGNMIRIGGTTLPISKRRKEEFLIFIQKKGMIG